MTEKAQPEWLTRMCPVCAAKPGQGCIYANWWPRKRPHNRRVIPPDKIGD